MAWLRVDPVVLRVWAVEEHVEANASYHGGTVEDEHGKHQAVHAHQQPQ